MAKKKRKRQQQREPESPVAAFLRRHPSFLRRLGIAAGLVVAAVAIWFLVDPLASPPTAIGENGEEVTVGTTDWPGNANANNDSLPANFVLPDFDNRAVFLDQFQGKTVFLNFWATWCGPCRQEMPDIVRIAEDFPDDVVVLAVNRGESRDEALDWVRELGLPEDLPNFYWLHDDREPVWRAYRQGNSMPQSYFLGSNGQIRGEAAGGLEYQEMLVRVERARGSGGNFVVD